MSGYHVPALLDETLQWLAPTPGERMVDATLGGGGHAEAILERLGDGGVLLGLDQDDDAHAEAGARLARFGARLRRRKTNFSHIADAVRAEGWSGVDGVLMDLGVSSHQLDTPERGFAVRLQGPLDMKMDATSDAPDAADLVNELPEAEIARILFEYGEEARSRRIAAEIVRARPLRTTEDLVDAVRRAMPMRTRPGQIHPATRTFQALRIAVNRELDVLTEALTAAVSVLDPGGRIVVLSYHSLEDRIVKNAFNTLSGKREGSDWAPDPVDEPILEILTRKPVGPTDDEVRRNPRARSAKLRAARRRPEPQKGSTR